MYGINWFYGWPRSTSSGVMGLGTIWTSDGLYQQILYSTAICTCTCGLVFMLFIYTVIIMPVQHTLMWLYVHDIYLDSCNEYQYLWLYKVQLWKQPIISQIWCETRTHTPIEIALQYLPKGTEENYKNSNRISRLSVVQWEDFLKMKWFLLHHTISMTAGGFSHLLVWILAFHTWVQNNVFIKKSPDKGISKLVGKGTELVGMVKALLHSEFSQDQIYLQQHYMFNDDVAAPDLRHSFVHFSEMNFYKCKWHHTSENHDVNNIHCCENLKSSGTQYHLEQHTDWEVQLGYIYRLGSTAGL